MPQLALYLLGPPRVEREGQAVHIGRRKAVALLAYLAVEPRRHSRDALATLLWPAYNQREARADLRRTLSVLSRTLGRGLLTTDRETTGLDPDAELWLDVDAFRQRLLECEAHGHPVQGACPVCLAPLTEAVELYHDDFMAGFTLPDSPAFDEWQRYQTQGLRDELGSVLERLAGCHSAREETETAIAYARRWLELDPLREHAHRQLMVLYAQASRRTAALRQYRQCVRKLEEELGVSPAPETTALYERIRAESLLTTEPIVAKPAPVPARAAPAFLSDEAEAIEPPDVFVARERELAQLDGYLEDVLAGHGRVVFVTGGPGRGKSALMREFARRAMDTRPDLLAVMGNCNAYSGVGDPYLPFREVLAMLTGDVEGRWAAGLISTEHAQRLWAILPLAVQTLFDQDPHLIDIFLSGQALLSRASSAMREDVKGLARLREWVGRERGDSADLKPQYLFEQYVHVLRDLAVEHTLVLILDDLQWVDRPSASLLFHLGRHLAEVGGRVLVLGGYRPEEVALHRDEKKHPMEPVIGEFKRRFGDVQVDLAQADHETGRRFVDALLDSPANPLAHNRLGEGFRATLHARTAGHPLFTIELLRAMQERGDLVQENGTWVEGPDLDWEQLPARVEAVIEARVSRLNEDLRDLLAVASVEGEIFTAEVVARVLHAPEWDILQALSGELGLRHRLVREVDEERLEGGFLSRYRFAHALFQTYVNGRLSPGERRLLHSEVGAALEALYGDQSPSIAVPLAHHYIQAGEAEKAAEYLVLAGEQARRAYALEEAEQRYQSVLELLSSLSPSERAKTSGSRLLALKGLGLVHFASGQSTDAEAYLREAIALGKEIGVPPRELVRIYFWLGEVLYWQGRYDERLRIGEEGLALLAGEAPAADGGASTSYAGPAEALESVEGVLMYQLISGAHGQKGNHEKSFEFANRNAQLVQHLPYTEELRPVYENIVILHWQDKDPEEMTKWLRIFENQALEHHDLTALAAVQDVANIGARGDLHGAVLKKQQALAVYAETGDTRYEGRNCSVMGEYLLRLGDLKGAELYSRRALETAEVAGFKSVQGTAHWVIGQIALCQGASAEAVDACQTALGLFDQTGDREGLGTLCTLGRAHLAQGDHEEAIGRFHEVMAMPSRDAGVRSYFMPQTPPPVLSGLEEAYADPEAFCAFCSRFYETHPQSSDLPTIQWFLEPANPAAVREPPLQRVSFAESTSLDCALSSDWAWHDLYDDCSFCVTAGRGLEIHAANGRDLWAINLSAPRLLRKAPENTAWAVQTICSPASADKPAIGGLLLWKDQENYLRLDRGTAGEREIAFQGCIGNQDLIIGRGRLNIDAFKWIFLRLERIGDRVNALCSADGTEWFTVGYVDFPVEDPVQIGLHAIGNIDRNIYHGAYRDGTAIRFVSFTLWVANR
jgi:DNA-binding SARP family transcriptional activator